MFFLAAVIVIYGTPQPWHGCKLSHVLDIVFKCNDRGCAITANSHEACLGGVVRNMISFIPVIQRAANSLGLHTVIYLKPPPRYLYSPEVLGSPCFIGWFANHHFFLGNGIIDVLLSPFLSWS